MTAKVPQSLHQVVRARRRAGWRLYLAPSGLRRVLAPLVWGLRMVAAAVLSIFGLAFGLMPIGNVFVTPSPETLGYLFTLPTVAFFGGAIVCGAMYLAAPAVRFVRAFHRIDIRQDRIVLSGWFRRMVIEIVDLSGIMVRENSYAVEVVLRAGERLIVCPAFLDRRLARRDLPEVAALLGEVLAPAEVPVRHCRAAGTHWGDAPDPPLNEGSVANTWQVSVEDVAALADRFKVRRTEDGRFDTYDVEWWTERVRAITSERDSG